jgi:ATP-dependent Lon protease
LLPAENRQNVEEDLTADQTSGVEIHYVNTIDEVLEIALPSNPKEERQDEQVREQVLQTVDQ